MATSNDPVTFRGHKPGLTNHKVHRDLRGHKVGQFFFNFFFQFLFCFFFYLFFLIFNFFFIFFLIFFSIFVFNFFFITVTFWVISRSLNSNDPVTFWGHILCHVSILLELFS